MTRDEALAHAASAIRQFEILGRRIPIDPEKLARAAEERERERAMPATRAEVERLEERIRELEALILGLGDDMRLLRRHVGDDPRRYYSGRRAA